MSRPTLCPNCKTEITVELHFKERPPRPNTLEDALNAAEFWNVTVTDLRAPRKTKRLNVIRKILYVALRKRGHTYESIASVLSRDHSTVVKVCASVSLATSAAVAKTIEYLEKNE